jgi:hypothetical protein
MRKRTITDFFISPPLAIYLISRISYNPKIKIGTNFFYIGYGNVLWVSQVFKRVNIVDMLEILPQFKDAKSM